jgi:sodium/bile acid cotransporter 7
MKFIQKHWFLASLLLLMAMGAQFANPFESLAEIEWLKWLVVSATMFLMAWPLEFGKLQQSFARPAAPLLGAALNLLLIPLLVWPLAALAGAELGPGIIITAATPSTLASAAVLTRYAGGDDSVAVMVTILTNATCFFVMPFWIFLQTGDQIDSAQLSGTIHKLFFYVVIPITLAQLARRHRSSADWATQAKPFLSKLALIGVLAMVFLGAVKMGLRFEKQTESPISLRDLLTTAVILISVHVTVFWLGILIAKTIGLPRPKQIAVGFSGSQKTLMIGLSTAVNLGFNIIPIVMYHSLQLIVDAVFAERLKGNESPEL